MRDRLLGKIVDEIEKTSEKVVGSIIKVGERKLIPIIEKTYFSVNRGLSKSSKAPKILAFRVKPVAFIVIENQIQTVLPIQRKDLSLNNLIMETPGLEDKIEKAKENISETE